MEKFKNFVVLTDAQVAALSAAKRTAYEKALPEYNDWLAASNNQPNKPSTDSVDLAGMFTFREANDSYFKIPIKILSFKNGFTTRKDGTAITGNASDLRIEVEMIVNGKKEVTTISAYRSMFPKGLPMLPLGGLEGIGSFKKQSALNPDTGRPYPPQINAFQHDEEQQHGRILRASKAVAMQEADI
jgi:hypothetical protein